MKSGVALVLRVSNVMLLEALEVDETRERMMADLADTSKIRICLPWLWIELSMAVEFYIVTRNKDSERKFVLTRSTQRLKNSEMRQRDRMRRRSVDCTYEMCQNHTHSAGSLSCEISCQGFLLYLSVRWAGRLAVHLGADIRCVFASCLLGCSVVRCCLGCLYHSSTIYHFLSTILGFSSSEFCFLGLSR